ncbi:MAG: estA [Chloroflexi bacterium]|nr:estA [Chloroflexota bacterium]
MKGFWGEEAGLRYVQVEPDDAPADLPLIFAIHGRGADASDLAGLASEIDPEGYRWVLPQGPRPLQLGPGVVGWAWYELDSSQESTVLESRERLSSFLDATLDRLGASRDRAAIMGFSQGAVMALHVGLASEEPFAGVVVMSGHLPAEEALRPLLPNRRDRRVLLVHGTYDQTLPIERGRHIRQVLESAGLQPEYHEFPMEHQITPDSLAVVRDYLKRVLPPGPGSPSLT